MSIKPKHTWRKANLLSEDDLPLFDDAAIAATRMENKQWIFWLNRVKQYKYSLLCKMAKQVNLCTPGPAFYPKMRAAGFKLLKAQDTSDDLLWKQ